MSLEIDEGTADLSGTSLQVIPGGKGPDMRDGGRVTKLPQEKQQIPEDAEGPGLPEGSEAPVEVTPEPAAPPV